MSELQPANMLEGVARQAARRVLDMSGKRAKLNMISHLMELSEHPIEPTAANANFILIRAEAMARKIKRQAEARQI